MTGAYSMGQWLDEDAALFIHAGDFPAGQYVAWVRVVTADEDVRRPSGRVRVGDVRE